MVTTQCPEQLDCVDIAPVQVFEYQDQSYIARELIEGRQQFAGSFGTTGAHLTEWRVRQPSGQTTEAAARAMPERVEAMPPEREPEIAASAGPEHSAPHNTVLRTCFLEALPVR